jgi:hypothetical protein
MVFLALSVSFCSKSVVIGPEAWHSTDDHWAYEYQLKPMGLLTAPRLHAVRASKEPLPD